MEMGSGGQNQENPYVAYDGNDTTYFGAGQVIKVEREYIRSHRGVQGDEEPDDLTGLALSGGGIRSASFSLGVMQALAYRGWLEKIDYLSTVSGGGYIGSSITWILENDPRFGMAKNNFPYASYPMSGEARSDEDREPLSQRLATISALFNGRILKGRILSYLRQNAKYLTPGNGINIFSLVTVALRGSILGLMVYGGLLTLLFLAFMQWKLFEANKGFPLVPYVFCQNSFLLITFIGLVIFAASILLYAVGTIVFSRWQRFAYPVRRFYECFAGYLLPFILALSIVGSLPYLHDTIVRKGVEKPLPAEGFKVSAKQDVKGTITFQGEIRRAIPANPQGGNAVPSPGGRDNPADRLTELFGKINDEMKAVSAGIIAILVGFASAAGAFVKTSRMKAGKLPLGLFVTVGVVALLFGLLIFGYSLALAMTDIPMWLLCAGIAILVALAFANINHLSLHRFYRDRLMETFMPNVSDVLDGRYERSHKSSRANTLALHIMCARTESAGKQARPGPYHIINTNVVLVSSKNAKYRGRGGDSFILSPAYCGSNATGWRQTELYMNGDMTLASAMAISGAALNPSAGCGGEGITRSPFLSVLMGLLNFRLGYWVPNPRERTDWRGARVPNSFLPGLCEVAFRGLLNERSKFLQLSDGGHFENLALYELIRRKLKLIIVCDGSADPKFTFSDLANAVEKVRSDFGALIMIESSDLDKLIPKGEEESCAPSGVPCAEQAYLTAKIKYADNSEGRLLYITTTFFRQLSADLYGYKKEHPAFPDEPTGDQFFDEKQFEAYRELGFQAAWSMMADGRVVNDEIVKSCMTPSS
jgi:hypothetical protein